jgi:sugar lactone lactonase YvrE
VQPELPAVLSRKMRAIWALVAALLHLPSPVHSQCATGFFGSGCQQVYSLTTVAGFLGVTGFVDGGPQDSRLNSVTGMALDSRGNVWFSESSNSALRVLNVTTGNVSNFLSGGTYVTTPAGMAFDSGGVNLSYCDTAGFIRRINTATGVASAVAGTGGIGTASGFGSTASFRSPRSLTFDGFGNLIIADTGNNVIRIINTSYYVSLLAGGGGSNAAAGYSDGIGSNALFSLPFAVMYCNLTGNIIVAEPYAVRVVTPGGNVSTLAGTGATGPYVDGTLTSANFTRLYSATLDAACNVYAVDVVLNSNPVVRLITPGGVVSTVAGNPSRNLTFNAQTSPTPPNCRTCGDGYAGDGLFEVISGTYGMAGPDALGNLYVGSQYRIRRLSPTTLPPPSPPSPPSPPLPPPSPPPPPWGGLLTTPSYYSATTIWPRYASATADGVGTLAGFFQPWVIAVNTSDGSMYVIEYNANKIRFVTAAGVVTTVAGSSNAGFQDGQGSNAMFNNPKALAVLGNLVYICDSGNNVIRAMTRDGVVTTMYGSGVSGYADGFNTSAQFTGGGVTMGGIAADPITGNLYVADSGANLIRLIQPNGNVSLYAGGGNGFSSGFADGPATSAQFWKPNGLAFDSNGTLWVADTSNQRIRGVLANRTVFTLAGDVGGATCPTTSFTGNCFYNPTTVAADNFGNLYVTNALPGTSYSALPPFLPQVISTSTGQVQLLMNGCPPGGTPYPGTGLVGVGCNGYIDGPASSAAFNYVAGIATDASGNLLLLDAGNGMIRKVTMSSPGVPANISTVAGALYVDPSQVMTMANSGTAGFGLIAFDFSRNVTYYTGSVNNNILLRSLFFPDLAVPNMNVVAGGGATGRQSSGANSFIAATGTAAIFNGINGMAVNSASNLIYVSTGGAQIVTVNAGTGSVARFLGTSSGSPVDSASTSFMIR